MDELERIQPRYRERAAGRAFAMAILNLGGSRLFDSGRGFGVEFPSCTTRGARVDAIVRGVGCKR